MSYTLTVRTGVIPAQLATHQGRPVTVCPNCGRRRDHPLLRWCAACRRTRL